jgi:virginiamycin B lyase
MMVCGSSPAWAVLVAQHVLPKGSRGAEPAIAVSGSPEGLLASDVTFADGFSTLVPGASLTATTGAPGSPATAFGIGPDGNVWYVGGDVQATPALFDIAPGGAALRFALPAATNQYEPVSLAAGPEGAVWMADVGAGAIERWMPGQGFSVFPQPIGGPSSIVAGPNGHMWFTDIATGDIGEIDSAGDVVEHPLAGTGRFGAFGDAEPYQILMGPDGALWFTEQNAGRIGRMTGDGQLQEFAVPNTSGAPAGWLGSPAPRHIVLGPDGALWFTDPGDNSIGRITLAGAVTEYPAAATYVTPDQITSSGGELWFTEDGASALGSVNPNATPASVLPAKTSKRGTAASLMRWCTAMRAKTRAAKHRAGHVGSLRRCLRHQHLPRAG